MKSRRKSDWKIEFTEDARSDLKGIASAESQRIVRYLEERVLPAPRAIGQALTGNYSGYWRYRVGDYRVICKLEDAIVTVTVIKIGHRRNIYQR